MNGIEALVPMAGVALQTALVVFLRVGAMMSVAPAFGERAVPVRVKLVLAMAFTLIVLPAAAATDLPDAQTLGAIVRLTATETMSGLALGLVLRLFVLGLQTAGSMIAQSTSLSQIFGGTAAEPMPAIGHLLIVAGLALAAMSGLHVRIAQYLILSYEVMPAGEFLPAADLLSWGRAHVVQAFALAFTIAAPFVAASLIYNLALGAINKAMPQLMVAFVGAPVITAGGLILLFLVTPMMLTVWLNAMHGFMAAPFQGVP